MRWSLVALGLAAVSALVASSGACGSQITVPDQGIIVTGCQMPASCFATSCSCTRAATLGMAIDCVPPDGLQCTSQSDRSTCNCGPIINDAGVTIQTQCLEPAQACVGQGVICGGAGALCMPVGSTTCTTSTPGAAPPQLIPTVGMPMLEPHCQFKDDVCCPGALDGGVGSD
jgi:hypothetical protein